eukprot:scaffold24048_cov194-Amphora_coffeaeformis.AAC.29
MHQQNGVLLIPRELSAIFGSKRIIHIQRGCRRQGSGRAHDAHGLALFRLTALVGIMLLLLLLLMILRHGSDTQFGQGRKVLECFGQSLYQGRFLLVWMAGARKERKGQ